MLNYPKTTAAKALCVCEVQDPSKSGVVVSNEVREVQFFVEKPVQCISNKVNWDC